MPSNEPDEVELPDRPREHISGTGRIDDAADGLESFNSVLWELAKSMWIIMVMLLGVFLLVIAYYLVEFVATL